MQDNTHTVVVTGACGGVGSAITEVCSRAGMFVIASDGPWHGGPDSGAEYVPIDLEKFVLDEKYQDERTYQLRAALPKSTNRLTLINNAAMQVLCAQPPTNPNDWNKTFCVNNSSRHACRSITT